MRPRAAALALFVAALSFGTSPTRAADGAITGVVTADVSNNTLLTAGQTVTVTLQYDTPYALTQVYLNVQAMDLGAISPAPERIDPMKQGDVTVGSSVLWRLDGSHSGSVSVQCIANPSFAAAIGSPTSCSSAGGVNSGDGAGAGGLVRTNGVFWRYAAPTDLDVAIAATVKPAPAEEGTASPGSVVHYVVTGAASSTVSGITLTNTLPEHVTLLPKSVKPPADVDGRTLTWEFPGVSSAQASFDVRVDAADKVPESFEILVDALQGTATQASGPPLAAEAANLLRLSHGTLDASLVDANPYFLPDVLLPQRDAAKLLAVRDWANRYTRIVPRVAADGVSLLLLRTKVDAPLARSVRFEILEESSGTFSQGGLAQVDDVSLIDDSADGGARDATGDGAQSLTAPVGDEGEERYAYALYRSPRNFDGTDLALSGVLNHRTVRVRAQALDAKGRALRARVDEPIVVVRPLVILQHGTFDSPRGWLEFPLWTRGGNEYGNFSIPPGGLPFQVARTSFEFVERAAGRAIPSAFVALGEFHLRLVNWAGATDTAAAQADVVTHSYGGVVMRLVAQGAVSTDPGNPMTLEQDNFRSARNWGHGMMHKLIAIAATHRGSHTGNHLAVVNHSGKVPGLIRYVAEMQEAAIDRGAVEDQMVLSPLLRTLAETRVPCHAIVGSGLPEHNVNYANRFAKVAGADRSGGPYGAAGSLYRFPYTPLEEPDYANFRRLINYVFDVDYTTLADDTLQDPNYDLTVSSYSMKGRMPRAAYSDHSDLETSAGLPPGSLVGRLTHGDEIAVGAAGDPAPMNAVANRVVELLQAPTAGPLFARFPATSAAPPTPLETTLSDASTYGPAWLYETIQSPLKDAPAATSPPPTLAAPAVGSVVAPGQRFDVTISWPGETLAGGFVVWPAGAPGEEPFLDLAPGASGFTVEVGATRQPGPFTVTAILFGADGVPREAQLALRVEDTAQYVLVGVRPGGLFLTTVHPVRIAVEGQLPGGAWQDVLRSNRTTLSSSDPTVATISADGVVQAVGIGETTITATLAGAGSAQIPVVVAGSEVPVGALSRKKPPVLRASSRKAAKFAFFSDATFDASRIDAASVFVNGLPPLGVVVRDVNRDRRPDLLVTARPADLGLVAGAQSIYLLGVTAGGSAVSGNVAVVVK